jgi:hypothetical protein
MTLAATLLRMLVALAMIAMPLAMAPAAAQAEPAAAMMDDGHCGEQPSGERGKLPLGLHCAGTCTALPSTPAPLLATPEPVRTAFRIAAVSQLRGATPPPATPPPRSG